jgi:signal transduction histidine kinase
MGDLGGLAAHAQDSLSRRELREALRARDEFLSVAAHELRNPLTPITMQVAILLRKARAADPPLPADIVAGLERLELATGRFLKRATVLLDVSRLVAGHPFRPDVSPVDLSALAIDCVTDHRLMADRVHSRIDATAVELGVEGVCDRVGVELIVDNLLSNAMKYGAGAPIEVGLTRQDRNTSGGQRVALWVRDNGPGIAAEDHDRIFERFQQAREREATAGGFGVGLWVAREVARGMGGDIGVESRPGAGARFSVVLPQDVATYLRESKKGQAG